MKKPKLLIKVDRNNCAKVYFNKKWHDDITKLTLFAVPRIYNITLEQNKRNEKGVCYVENGEIAKEIKTFVVGKEDNLWD